MSMAGQSHWRGILHQDSAVVTGLDGLSSSVFFEQAG